MTSIKKILIANNGMAAVKAIRSIRKWSFETHNTQICEFIVMCTPEDLSVNAEYIRIADQFVEVPGGPSHYNYNNVELIIETAMRTKADAVYVGWGYQSENPVLAERLLQQGIVFMGPPPEAMRSLGDKIASTIVAQSAGVPCVKWSGDGLLIDSNKVPDDIYQKACIHTLEQGLEQVKRIGLPVMVKASEGGGGKGIRLIYELKEFENGYNQVVREVPGSPVFIMQVVKDARHLEVQILADASGNAIALFGRDCSVQRRHQKIIEEAPVSIAPLHVRQKMEACAIQLAKLVGYTSAGTVEYLYHPETNEFYFLELNPRLQVEHPTTEMVSGVNIPAAQLQIAMGKTLHEIKDIRVLYGVPPHTTTLIDFEFKNEESRDTQRVPTPKGHVIAARITAENPTEGFKPNSGKILELDFKSSQNVWGYFSTRGGVHEFADSQFGHLFSYGQTREEARKCLVMALQELNIRGEFWNTVGTLVDLLERDAFINNEFTTSWLDRLISEGELNQTQDTTSVICASSAMTFLLINERQKAFVDVLAKGNIPNSEYLLTTDCQEFQMAGVQFKFENRVCSETVVLVSINHAKIKMQCRLLVDGGVLVLVGGKSHIVYIKNEVNGATAIVDGNTYRLEQRSDPSKLRSVSPGKLVRFLIPDGGYVESNAAYAEIEVMKMVMPLVSTASGVLGHVKPAGSILSNGDLVATLQLDNPSSIPQPKPFDGLINLVDQDVEEEKPHHKLKRWMATVESIMNGYELEYEMDYVIDQLMRVLNDPTLAGYELCESLGSISSRIPPELSRYLFELAHNVRDGIQSLEATPAMSYITDVVDKQPLDNQDSLLVLLEPLMQILKRHEKGQKVYVYSVIEKILDQYHKIEHLFETSSTNRVMLQLREEYMDRLETVMDLARALSKPNHRQALIFALLDVVGKDTSSTATTFFTPTITNLAQLNGSQNTTVSIKARELLISYQLPTLAQRRDMILTVFAKAYKKSSDGNLVYLDFSQLSKLISSRYSMLDIVPEVFFFPEQHLRAIALYAYVMRTSSAFTVNSFEHHYMDGTVALSWDYSPPDQNMTPVTNKSVRRGIIFMSENMDSVVDHVKSFLSRVDTPTDETMTNKGWYATVALKTSSVLDSDDDAAKLLQEFVTKHQDFIEEHKIRRLTFLIQRDNSHSRYFTFKASLGFKEDQVIRHIEPFMSDRLELPRLANFEITPMEIVTRGLRMYHAVGKENPSDKRFFIRGIIHPSQVNTFYDFFISEASRITGDILDTLELLMATHPNTDCNHVLLHFLPVFHLTKEHVHVHLEKLLRKNMTRFAKLRITQAEICFLGLDGNGKVVPFRLVVEMKSKFVLDICWYAQQKDSTGDLKLYGNGPLDGKPVHRLHDPRQVIQPKRYQAHLLGTSYVYDFPALFKEALKKHWGKAEMVQPERLIDWTELVLNGKGELEETDRPVGMNTCGMVAFKMTLYTPEYPQGRSIIIIANDITFQMGSFGPSEDLVFLKVSQLARQLGLPRIYISANSGARIGLADEIMSKYKIAWVDPANPAKGFDYLYLTQVDFEAVNADSTKPSVTAEKLIVDNTVRYKLTSVIGQKDGLGVECLHGSGEIAGETSLAYQEIFTLTLVTCRSVGIGAYLNRLGQRVIQVEYAPIILTGAGALNKVLGRQVYSSNLQLGGTRIMYHNGVSHLTAEDDLQGVLEVLTWLCYIPEKKNGPLPILKPNDAIDRPVEVPLTKGIYDPRELLQGRYMEGKWEGGFFDRESFKETLSGWAKGIVVGRARLGGIPVGVISVETRITDTVIWADPAVETSQEETIKEAGQVWYPNSAFKTAQAIRDFNNGEQLPLFIFANWRGFSGGQSDMYKEVLKFGAQIVDALREFKQPIFIYIIGELRGGAWVVVDPSINSEMMEMYCYEDARGGVLEPEGIVEIKYRKPKIISTMHRIDPTYMSLKNQLKDSTKSRDELNEISEKLAKYEKTCIGVYEQAAVELADLHDRPQRMLQKGVIRDIVEWKSSREYFYWRLHRRIKELEISRQLNLARNQSTELVDKWLKEDLDSVNVSDEEFVKWCSKNNGSIQKRVNEARKDQIFVQLQQLYQECPDVFKQFVMPQ